MASATEPAAEAQPEVLRHFPYPAYRPHQRETILAIVDTREPGAIVNPREQKLDVIMQRCLQAAQVKYICVYPPQLPRYRELRERILGPALELDIDRR